jgi:dihydrodipicolinate synthase/N-acetylneuraminate lyase
MPQYHRNEARAWARQHLTGCSAVTIPSFSTDLKRLNEKAIRFDVERAIGMGFSYTLMCTEVMMTAEENARATAWAKETAAGRMGLFFHAAWGSLADNIEAVKLAEEAGADFALLSYPPQFWPTTEQEIYDYTRGFCDATKLGVMLFPIPFWGFERINPAGMSVALIRRLLKDCPNIVAVKSEQGFPLPAGICEMYHHFRDEVVISCPIEADIIPLMSLMKLQFSGTSNTQWMGDYFPKAFELARTGEFEAAMDLYWSVSPARGANSTAVMNMRGTGVINRTMWKYMDWLAGFNGGPLRAPSSRVQDSTMRLLRNGLQAAGRLVATEPDKEFMVGRFPC